MRYLLMIAAALLLGGCAAETGGNANPAAAAGDARGVDLWTPKPGLTALVQVLDKDAFYKLANKLRPDLANRPLGGMGLFHQEAMPGLDSLRSETRAIPPYAGPRAAPLRGREIPRQVRSDVSP